MSNEYFVDYPELLNLNIDYAKDVSLAIDRVGERFVPVMSYRGLDRRAGENIIRNIEKMISIRPDENNGLRLFIGQEQFARFVEDKQAGEIRLDTEAPQKHLTSFEMRMLARREQQTIFSRDEINGLAHSTDLHTHFAGCLSPEDLIEAGLEHNISIPADLLKKAGIDLSRYKTDGHNNVLLNDLAANRADIEKYAMAMRIPLEQQETFNKMEEIYVMRGPFTKNAEMFPTLLRKVATSHAAAGIKYAEFSLSSVIGDLRVLETLHKELPQIERDTGCKMRFLAAMWRHSDKEWNQDEVDRIKAVAASPYVVGIDFMGHETNPTEAFGDELKEIAKWAALHDPDFVMRVHAGENPLFQDNVKDVLKVVRAATKEAEAESGRRLRCPAVRIGHGLYGVDEECLNLCRETNAVIEFNMASNLSLNNIDNITDVPLKKYVDHGVRCVLGSDGMGLYSTSPQQDVILAHAAGLTRDDLLQINKFEERLIVKADRRFEEKQRLLDSRLAGGAAYASVFKPVYSTADGLPHYTDEVSKRKNEEKAKLQKFLDSEISRIGAQTDKNVVYDVLENRVPILVTGASVKAWPNISAENQDEIRTAMQVLVNVIDPEKACILTGGTNHGVEKQLHEAAHNRNQKSDKKLAVIGTLTEEAAYTERASIENNTITHAVVLELNGRPAKKWFDLPDTVLDIVEKRGGEMIAVGGGGVVRDMIQRAHNMKLGINLMDGPEGASTDKAAIMPEYAFKGAQGLIKKLYAGHPEIFNRDFDPAQVDEYVSSARRQQRSLANIGQLKQRMGIRNKSAADHCGIDAGVVSFLKKDHEKQ